MTSLLSSPTPSRSRWLRIPIMLGVVLSAVIALWAGLVRIGWTWPDASPRLLLAHGPLMVCGALMTLIGLERAIALSSRWIEWPFVVPMLGAAGAMGLIVGWPAALSALCFTFGSAALVAVCVLMVRLQPATFTRALVVGAALLLVGNGLWLAGWPIFRIAPWWIGFLVLTIASERLELGRVQHLPSPVMRAFAAAALAVCAGIVLSAAAPDVGIRLMGAGLLVLAIWLLRYDVARRTVHTPGLTGFIGACLLSGHVWLAVTGGLMIAFGAVASGPRYDAQLHALLVGFVFSMIFGHAPIIVPAVLGVAIAPLQRLYAPLLLLHASLGIRIVGDVLGAWEVRRWGGLLNVAAVLAYFGLMIYAAAAARNARRNETRSVVQA